MFDTALLTLTWRVTRKRFLGSPPALAAALAFPAFVAWIGLQDSYGTAARIFYFILPHAFLLAAQDTVRTDIESGVLENALFSGGRFRGFLMAKGLVAAAVAGAYVLFLSGLFAAWGMAIGAFRASDLVRIGLALIAGLYYVALAGILSHFLRGGSNVLALLLAQAAVLVTLLFTVSARTGLLDHAASGRFPGLGPKLLFGGLALILPNVIVTGRPTLFAAGVLAGLLAALLIRTWLLRRLELGWRRGS
ncbi:MAG: hypothetical protein HGA24_09690 [Candidatus Aminicenantes bacterium]|nr:hypothetical protein [Candidatus Aminicenantes bacterium]